MKAINWNRIEDPVDLEVWNRLTNNFWLPEKVPISNDIKMWDLQRHELKNLTMRVFGGLTLLDTLQSNVGAPTLSKFALTEHEKAVYANITFMEAVHARSYSSIFTTLCKTNEIDSIFTWVDCNVHLQKKAALIENAYHGARLINAKLTDQLKGYIASVFPGKLSILLGVLHAFILGK